MCTDLRCRPRSACARAIVIIPFALMLSGCNGTTSFLDATGTAGRAEATLGIWLTVTASVVVAFVCVALLVGIARHRRTLRTTDAGDPESARRPASHGGHRHEISGGLNWIYIGTGITVVVLCTTYFGTMMTLRAASRPEHVSSTSLEIIGHQWWWEVRYLHDGHPELGFTTANEVHLPVGEAIRVRLRSADVIHSFWLPQIAGKMDLIPGQVNEMWVEARTPATTRGTCAEYCGMQHAVMALTVVAESPDAFREWEASRRSPATLPADAEQRAGRAVFARSCGGCHTVAGSEVLGVVGPDLTHIASRPYIGAGALENTTANLARWIEDAQLVKPGVQMPAMRLDSAQLRDVVAYIQSLH